MSTIFRLPPPLFYLIAIILGLIMNQFFFIKVLPEWWEDSIATALMIVSGIIIPFVVFRYLKLKTPFFNVYKPASALITDGLNEYSRNPGYCALTLLYLGIGVNLNNIWILGLSVPIVLVMDFVVIRREERQLEAIFGHEYLRYKLKVPKWI